MAPGHSRRVHTMKKNAAPARIETKPAKTLFGISSDALKAVNGGGGVIVKPVDPNAPSGSAG